MEGKKNGIRKLPRKNLETKRKPHNHNTNKHSKIRRLQRRRHTKNTNTQTTRLQNSRPNTKMISCKRCEYSPKESKIQLHHKIPKCIGGTDKDGRVYLCQKCHDIWHYMLPKFIFKFVPEEKKEDCRQYIKKMCDWFITKK